MKSRITLLAALLGVQILLGLAVFLGPRLGNDAAEALKLPVTDPAIDQIEIAGKDQSVKLQRRDGNWYLPDYFDVPANPDAVKLLQDRLEKLEGGTPVATSSEAQKRFKVDDAGFERRVTFRQGDKQIARVWLGSQASRNRTHLRADGNDAIFEESIGIYDLPLTTGEWVNKKLLHVPATDIASLRVGDITLRQKPAAAQLDASAPLPTQSGPAASATEWSAEGLPAGSTLNQLAATQLGNLIAELNYEAVLGLEAKPEYGLASPAFSLQLQRTGGAPRDYRFGKMNGEDAWVLQVSDRKEFFKLLSYQVQSLIDAAKPETLSGTAQAQ